MSPPYLLDSQVWVWHLTSPERMSDPVRALIRAGGSDLALSHASVWELSIKAAAGRLALPRPTAPFLIERARQRDIGLLPIERHHIEVVEQLPFHHRDPFDRMLVAQCITEGRTLITADVELKAYPIELVLAARP